MTMLRRRLTGLLAAVLLVGIMVGLPATLLNLGGNPLPNQPPSLSDLSEALTSPDDGPWRSPRSPSLPGRPG
jgi:hypothetical protein